MYLVIVQNEEYGSYAEKINMSHFCLNLGQTAEDSEMFTHIWLSSKGLKHVEFGFRGFHCNRSSFSY